MSGKSHCWVVGACLGDDIVVIGVVVTAERATVYPAKSVNAAGWVSGSKVSQRDDGGSRQCKQRGRFGKPSPGFLLVFGIFSEGMTDGRGVEGDAPHLLPVSLEEAEGELMTGRSRPRGGYGFAADSSPDVRGGFHTR